MSFTIEDSLVPGSPIEVNDDGQTTEDGHHWRVYEYSDGPTIFNDDYDLHMGPICTECSEVVCVWCDEDDWWLGKCPKASTQDRLV